MCQSPSTTGGSSRYPAVAVAELHHGFVGLTNGRLVVTSGMKPLRTICLYFPMPHRSTKTEVRNS